MCLPVLQQFVTGAHDDSLNQVIGQQVLGNAFYLLPVQMALEAVLNRCIDRLVLFQGPLKT